MMFRKLYWVAEECLPTGEFSLKGVFTSIPNLIRNGFEEGINLQTCRLSLTRLDTSQGTVASWSGDRLKSMASDLTQFVATEDISEDQRQMLAHWIESHAQVAA